MMRGLFIVGHWNSGTTLLVDLLRRHPDLWLRNARFKPNLEERDFVKILRRHGGDYIHFDPDYKTVNREGFTHYREPELSPEQAAAIRRQFGLRFWTPKSRVLLAKNPWWMFSPKVLKKVFEQDDIRWVIILRHGAMQTVSKDYWKRSDGDPRVHLLARAQFWVRAMEFFFEHWAPHPDTLTLRYENLCTDPRNQLRNLADHAGISPDPLLKILPTLSNRTEKWQALDTELRRQVWEVVAPMQKRVDSSFPVTDPAFSIIP